MSYKKNGLFKFSLTICFDIYINWNFLSFTFGTVSNIPFTNRFQIIFKFGKITFFMLWKCCFHLFWTRDIAVSWLSSQFNWFGWFNIDCLPMLDVIFLKKVFKLYGIKFFRSEYRQTEKAISFDISLPHIKMMNGYAMWMGLRLELRFSFQMWVKLPRTVIRTIPLATIFVWYLIVNLQKPRSAIVMLLMRSPHLSELHDSMLHSIDSFTVTKWKRIVKNKTKNRRGKNPL